MADIEYTVKRECRKTLSIKISSLGDVVVKAPIVMPDSTIKRFLSEKSQWITRTHRQILAGISKIQHIVDYNSVMLLGETYPIRYTKTKDIRLFEGEMLLPESSQLNMAHKKSLLCKFISTKAESILPSILQICCAKSGLEYNTLSFNNNKTRWGFCDSRKNLSFNWRSIMLERQVLEYLIIHELIHTRIFNHSASFWSMVGEHCPGYRTHRKTIKDLGSLLQLYRK